MAGLVPEKTQNSIANRHLKIAVLAGGIGSERQISIQSGKSVAEALKQTGLNVVLADITPDNLDILEDKSINVFFPVLHGRFGEDGQLQQILEEKSLVYTGSAPTACELAFDKMASKKIFERAGISTPKAVEFKPDINTQRLKDQLLQFSNKWVVKPIRQGSSVGIYLVDDINEVIERANKVCNEFGNCMIEEFVHGREITVGILKDKTLPIIEVISNTDFYNYHAKYIDEQTKYLFGTIENEAAKSSISAAALDCFEILSCRHFARADFILNDNGIAHVLEVNTIPGFTAHSLLPKAAAERGLSVSDLCMAIIEEALVNEKASLNC